jgi:hypothetical protein
MNARELLGEIEANGGTLTLLPDSNLRWRNVAPELLALMPPLKIELVVLLQERDKQRRKPSLFTAEELDECRRLALAQQNVEGLQKIKAMQTAGEKAENAAAQVPDLAQKFVYRPRDPELLEQRIQQGAKRNSARRYWR